MSDPTACVYVRPNKLVDKCCAESQYALARKTRRLTRLLQPQLLRHMSRRPGSLLGIPYVFASGDNQVLWTSACVNIPTCGFYGRYVQKSRSNECSVGIKQNRCQLPSQSSRAISNSFNTVVACKQSMCTRYIKQVRTCQFSAPSLAANHLRHLPDDRLSRPLRN